MGSAAVLATSSSWKDFSLWGLGRGVEVATGRGVRRTSWRGRARRVEERNNEEGNVKSFYSLETLRLRYCMGL